MIKPDYYNKYKVSINGLNVYPLDYFDQYHFMLGNVLKYLLRYQDKGGKEDLEKALTYLEHSENKEMLVNDSEKKFTYLFAKTNLREIFLTSNGLLSRFINLNDLYEKSSYEERKEKFYEPLKTLVKQEIERLEREPIEKKNAEKKEVEETCEYFLNMLKELFSIEDKSEYQLINMYFRSDAVRLVEHCLNEYMKDYEDSEKEKLVRQSLTNIIKAFMCSIKHLLQAMSKLEGTTTPCLNNCAGIFEYQPLLLDGTLNNTTIEKECVAISDLLDDLNEEPQSSNEIFYILYDHYGLFAPCSLDAYRLLEQK